MIASSGLVAAKAAREAIASPLLELSMDGARGVLFNIVGGADMTMTEVNEAAKIISEAADADANIIFGAVIDEEMTDKIKITVIAAGFDETKKRLHDLVSRPKPVVMEEDIEEGGEKEEGDKEKKKGKKEKVPFHKEVTIEDEFDIPAFLRQGR